MGTFDGQIYFGIRRSLVDKTGALKSLKKLVTPFVTISLLMIMGLALSGCGGSGSGLSSEVVSGVAAVGAPLGGEVSLKDSSYPRRERTAVLASDGSFAIDVTGLKTPYILRCEGRAEGRDYRLHSYADGAGIANVNPLSDAIVASAAEVEDASEAYEEDDAEHASKIRRNISATVDTILNKLQPLLQRYNAHQLNPITSRYVANHLDLDDMFDNVEISVRDGLLVIRNEKTDGVIYSGKVSDIASGNFYSENVPPAPAIPVAPTGLTAVGGADQVAISWTSVSNATSYNVYYSTSSGVTIQNGTKASANASPYVQTALNAGTTYYFIVTAVNSAGESSASTQVSAGTTVAPPLPAVPSAPVNVQAAGGTKQVAVSWSAVSGATSYNIYYLTASGVTKANGTKIADALSPAVHTGLSDGTTYYYVVTAVNETGEGPASVQVAATTVTPVPVPVAPSAPLGVSAAGGANQVTVSWPAVAGATSYNIYRSTASGVSPANGTKIVGVTSPYTNTGLAAGTMYYFVVTAMNGAGESGASMQSSATTNAAPPAIPAAPTGVTATGGASQVSLNWTAVTGATSYNVYWSTVAAVGTAGTKITGAARPYVQTGLAPSTTYYYVVTAVNGSGESAPSAQAAATTNAPVPVVPAAPAGVTATGGTNQVTVSWNAVAGATTYNLYYGTSSGVTKASAKIVNAASPYVHTGLAAGTAYFYVVTAVNGAGEGNASAQATATTAAAPPPVSCTGCHGTPPTTGSHSVHDFTSCATCHGSGYSATTANAATHMNGIKNVGGTSGWNAANRTCSNSCHGSRSW